MVFWRKRKNAGTQEKERHEDRLLHHKNDPDLEPPTEYETEIGEETQKRLRKSENDILDELDLTPVPEHTALEDRLEAEALDDHTQEGGWFSRLTKGLSKSSNKIGQSITDAFTKRRLDDGALEELEDILIMADMGPKTASKIVQEFSQERFDKEVSRAEVQNALASSVSRILEPVAVPLRVDHNKKPFVILVCGVNGAGKTTTIGKMANRFKREEQLSVMLGAADTFRAAAIDQLSVWSDRAKVPLVKKDIGADSSAVAYEALEKAKAEAVDVLMIDTAGRLQNKTNLMAELEKMIRVLKKQDDTAPHAVLLVLDCTTGQNAHSQVQAFKELIDVTGLVVTKLDGSAKGGVVVSLAEEFGLPIHAVGVGEGLEDLRAFEAKDFAKALFA